jgi:hypothetical protein
VMRLLRKLLFCVMRRSARSVIHYLPIYGCISTGLIYTTIGIIAILSFLKIRDGGADESSMLMIMNDLLLGKVLIWVILTGTVSYMVWRVYETIHDPYDYGRSFRGIVKRAGIGLSSVADVLVVYAGIRVLLGISHIEANGQPLETRETVNLILHAQGGGGIVTTIGIAIVTTACIQLVYGFTKGYKERIDLHRFGKRPGLIIHALAWAGYLARGIILGITGFFFIKAGISGNGNHVVNTDKAFDFIGDHVGHVYFILVAIGTICYGLFMFALGITYKAQKV